ncbi:MAG: hypothetical protein GX557_06615 [Chloroflexi bacterium]|nr:hypothetical protein [Chloroflexota bacterium]
MAVALAMPARRVWSALLCLAVTLAWALPPSVQAQSWTRFGMRQGLLSRTLHCLAPTAEGGMLAGTSGGLNVWDGTRWLQFSAGNGLARGRITAVAQTDGALWAGSWGGGLSVLRGTIWRTYRAADSPLPSDWVAALASDGARLWIATYGGGLAALQDDAWTVYRRADGAGLPSDWLTCLLRADNGDLWVGSESAGLARLSVAGAWQTVALPPEAAGAVTALALAGDGALWVGTPAGVWRLAPGAAGRWTPDAPDAALVGVSVTALAAEADGALWVGTGTGLLHRRAGGTTRFTATDGLPHHYVSALALDVAGRLWVGTLTAGLAVHGELAPPTVSRLPVVLVHGWRSAESDRLEDSEFRHLAGWLRADGFDAYFATGILPENTLYENALALRDTIDRALRESGAAQVYLLAFSMGGLNARAYLETTLYRGDVARLFTLGSPHRGEDLWAPLLLWEHLDWSDEPSTLELLPTHMADYNTRHSAPDSVPYVLIAGDAGNPALAEGRLPTLFGELPASDGLVSVWSALGPAALAADRRLSGDLHAWAQETQLLDLPSLLLPRTTYDAHIRPFLFGVGAAPGTGSPVLADVAAGAEADAPRSALRVGEIAAGSTVSVPPIPVDAAGRTRLLLRCKGAPVEMRLIDPAGTAHSPTHVGAGVEYLELSFADFASYAISDTLTGEWQVTLATAADRRVASEYVLYAEWPDSAVRLRASASGAWVDAGEAVTLTATLSGPPGMTVRAVTADVYAPAGMQTLVFSPSRADAGARIYTAKYIPREGGYHSVLLSARGTHDGEAFERGADLQLKVRGSGARLLDSAPPEREELAGEENWVAPVTVTVTRAGAYVLTLTLTDEQTGAQVLVSHPMRLDVGEQRVAVPLGGLRLRDGGAYRLARLVLADISGAAVWVDSWTADPGHAGWRFSYD